MVIIFSRTKTCDTKQMINYVYLRLNKNLNIFDLKFNLFYEI